jgi:hypothetical protein
MPADRVLRVGPYCRALGLCRLPKLILEIDHLLTQFGIAGREDAYRKEPGVAGVADGDSCHGHPRWHLHHRQQGIHAVEILQRYRHPDHRQRSDCGQHARQVRRATRSRDDHFQAATVSRTPVVDHRVGHSVR